MKAYHGGKKFNKAEDADPNLLRVMRQTEEEEGVTVKANLSPEKYSEMLMDLIKPYHTDIVFFEELQSLADLAALAWNLACMKKLIPEAFTPMWNETRQDFKKEKDSLKKLESMIAQKQKRFGKYDMFIHKAEVHFNPDKTLMLSATAKPIEAFLADGLAEAEEEEANDENFQPGYVNRIAFTIAAKAPFVEWKKNLEGPLFPSEPMPNNVYLIEPTETDEEMEEWLNKNYDRVFRKELENWNMDEKTWPRHRNYQLFCEWFDISYQSLVYDLEDYPIEKDIE